MQEECISEEKRSLIIICQGYGSLLISHAECFQINGTCFTGYSVLRWPSFEDVLSREEFENLECSEQNSKKTPITI
jgi:hypothetical protein